MTEEEIKFCTDTLKCYLDKRNYLPESVAIYRRNDGKLTQSPFIGSCPPVAADGSDEIIYAWHRGSYKDARKRVVKIEDYPEEE